jgi:hypothetical protein
MENKKICGLKHNKTLTIHCIYFILQQLSKFLYVKRKISPKSLISKTTS